MNLELHSCTPVRHPQHTNKPDPTTHIDSQIWTATRCQRLLRPITSRIALLKKDPARFTSSGEPNASSEVEIEDVKILGIPGSNAESIAGGDDAYWRPARRWRRKTYSTRCKLKGDSEEPAAAGTWSKSTQTYQIRTAAWLPGEISVPTPFLNRSQVFVTNSPRHFSATAESTQKKMRKRPQSRYTTKDGDAHFQLAETMRRLGKSTASDRYKIYEGIYNALEALLRVTVSSSGRMHSSMIGHDYQPQGLTMAEQGISRSRSLFSMCLRNVPSHIKEQERLRVLESEVKGYKSAFDTRTISTETYSDLESLGTSCSGWVHLKTVVRVHGVQNICDAIQKGFIDAKFASALVMLCVHASASDEAQALLSSLLTAHQYPLPLSPQCRFCDIQAMLPLVTLDHFVKYTGRAAFYHRQLTRLITNGSLPLLWLGTKGCGYLWTSVFHALSINPCDRDAIAFIVNSMPLILSAAVSRVGKRGNESKFEMLEVLENKFLSVLATLSTMSILNINHTSLIVPLLRSIFLDYQFAFPKLDGSPAGLIATANIIVGMQPFEETDTMRSLIKVLTQNSRTALTSQHVREGIPDFVCAVAHCCGRGSSGDGFEHLALMLERLTTSVSLGTPDEGVVMRAIIANCAFAYAQHLPNQKSLEYAQHIGKQMHIAQSINMLSTNIDFKAPTITFRWEDGISEWVTASPSGLRNGPETRFFPSDEESDFETPLRPSIKRQKRALGIPKSSLFVTHGHCLKARISDFSPTSPVHGDKDPLSVMSPCYPIRKKLARLHKTSWTLSRKRNHGNGKISASQMYRFGSRHLCPNQDWTPFAGSDDELSSSSTSIADSTATITIDVQNSVQAIGKTQDRRSKSSDSGLARPTRLYHHHLEESEDELGL